MHPNPVFCDDDGALARVAAAGFAQIAIVTPDGPMMVHAPVTPHDGALRFHIARGNRATPWLDGTIALVGVVPVEGYVSPNWYAMPANQVPTWNYVAIEVEGVVRALDEAALVEQIDRLAAVHEPRVNPAAPWTRDKMDDHRFRAMLRGICGFELLPTAVRGTTKLSQNKSVADRAGVVAGLNAAGCTALVAAMTDVDRAR